MANLPISGLPAVVAGALTDILPVVQGGETRKETLQQLADAIAARIMASGNPVTATTIAASGDLTAPSINNGQFAGNRNRITNGGCQVAQTGPVTVTSALQYGGCDMFLTGITAATGITGTIQQGTGQATSSGYSQSLAAVSFTTGKPTFNIRMESRNVFDLSGKKITVSGKYFQDTGSALPLQIGVNKPTLLDNFNAVTNLYADSTQVAATGVYTAFKATFTLAAADAANGLEISVATLNALSATAKTFHVADFQVEVGEIATPFEQLHISQVIADCQRYLPAFIGANQFAGAVFSGSATSVSFTLGFPVQARIPPTGITLVSPAHYRYNNGAGNYIATAVTYVAASALSAQLSLTTSGIASGNLPGICDCTNAAGRLLFTGSRL